MKLPRADRTKLCSIMYLPMSERDLAMWFRLDKETSGAVLLPKPLSCLYSTACWKTRDIQREYWAVVGVTIEKAEHKDKVAHSLIIEKTLVDKHGHAETHVTRLSFGQKLLSNANSKTGQNSIRSVHLSHHGISLWSVILCIIRSPKVVSCFTPTD